MFLKRGDLEPLPLPQKKKVDKTLAARNATECRTRSQSAVLSRVRERKLHEAMRRMK
jgi:hypothetical protein